MLADKRRFQVFVSSTLEDLREERSSIIRMILELQCFPAAMETFPASDANVEEFVTKVIKESDYFILLIGDTYGSVNSYGMSYTELEFDIAVRLQKPICAFLKAESKNPDPRLSAFRSKVSDSGRIVRPWQASNDLLTSFPMSFINLQRERPAAGWIRYEDAKSEMNAEKISALESENARLQKTIQEMSADLSVTAEALTETQIIYYQGITGTAFSQQCARSEIVMLGLNEFMKPLTMESAEKRLAKSLGFLAGGEERYTALESSVAWVRGFLIAHSLIAPDDSMPAEWSLTASGRQLMRVLYS